MADALTPAPTRAIDLAMMSLDDCPDLWTAVEAGIMHGLKPSEALKSAFGKWMRENASAIQMFGLANFYDGPHADRAMVNYTRVIQYLAITCAEQSRQIAQLQTEQARVRALLPYLPPSSE